jgi:hypothetical protein
MSIDASQYKCGLCHGVFEKCISDDEAWAEAKELWDIDPDDDDAAIVCDDCFKGMTAILPPAEFQSGKRFTS